MLANATAHLEPVHARHVHIEQDDVEPARSSDQCLGTAVRARHLEPLEREILREHIRDLGLIIHHVHPHGVSVPRRCQSTRIVSQACLLFVDKCPGIAHGRRALFKIIKPAHAVPAFDCLLAAFDCL